MSDDNLITLAIHTRERALAISRILEQSGIPVTLEDVDATGGKESIGVRVKIPSSDLPLALHISENEVLRLSNILEMKMMGVSNTLLIPIDFSPKSLTACSVAFGFARTLGLHPVILHVYTASGFPGQLDSSDDFDGEITDVEMIDAIGKQARGRMKDFARKINSAKERGELPEIKFSTVLREGVPDDVIRTYVKEHRPALVVMATRGKDQKESELIGSVTAEVLDSCRVPVFAVPDNYSDSPIEAIRRVTFLCNLDDLDIIAMDTFVRIFSYRAMEVLLTPISDKGAADINRRLKGMADYFTAHYPEMQFTPMNVSLKSFRADLEREVEKRHIQGIVVPNKKKNVFSRLFNPGIAHRILFERDVPLLAIPV